MNKLLLLIGFLFLGQPLLARVTDAGFKSTGSWVGNYKLVPLKGKIPSGAIDYLLFE